MAYVYVLQSVKDGRYYVGSTIDINKRLKHHQQGLTPSTKRFGGVKLVFQEKYDDLRGARKMEKRLKKFKRRDFLEKIIKDGYIKIKIS